MTPRDPRQRFSAVASDRRSRPHISLMRDIFGVQSAAAPMATAFQHHPSSKGKRKRSFAQRVSALVNPLQNEFFDNDFQDSSSATPNDNAQSSDDTHQEDDKDRDTQETAEVFAKKKRSRPSKFGIPFIDGFSSLPRSRPKPFPTTKLISALGRKLAASKGTTTTSTPPVPASAIPVPATITNTPPAQDLLPTQDAPPEVVRQVLIKKRVCFHLAYDSSCPRNPCKYLHETSCVPYAWPRGSVSYNTSQAIIAAILHAEKAYGPQDHHDQEWRCAPRASLLGRPQYHSYLHYSSPPSSYYSVATAAPRWALPHLARGSMIGEGGDTTISSPGRSPKQPLPGIGQYDPLHGRQAYPEFITFEQGVGQICPR